MPAARSQLKALLCLGTMLACGSAFCVVLVRGLRMEVWGVGRVDNVGEDGCESLEKGVEGVVGLVVVMEELDKGLVDGDVDVDVVDVVVVVAAAAAAAVLILMERSLGLLAGLKGQIFDAIFSFLVWRAALPGCWEFIKVVVGKVTRIRPCAGFVWVIVAQRRCCKQLILDAGLSRDSAGITGSMKARG